MNLLSPRTLLPLAADSIRAPRETYGRLRALDLPQEVLWQALALVVCVSVILAEVTSALILSTADAPQDAARLASPLTFGLFQAGLLLLTVYLISWIGRGMGGTGDFRDGILIVAWLQFVMLCLQIVQAVFILLLPGLAGIVVIAGLAIFLWLLTAFITEAHGFSSMGKVFGMILVVLMGVALGLSFILTLSGATVAS